MVIYGPQGPSVAVLVSEPVSSPRILETRSPLMATTDSEKQSMLLVMRVLSIVPLNHKVRLKSLLLDFQLL